jgi:hypothetical protein
MMRLRDSSDKPTISQEDSLQKYLDSHPELSFIKHRMSIEKLKNSNLGTPERISDESFPKPSSKEPHDETEKKKKETS